MPGPPDSDRQTDLILDGIVAGTAPSSGAEHLPAELVRNLAGLLGCDHAVLAEWTGEGNARALALFEPSGATRDLEWELAGTPCREALENGVWWFPRGATRRFPGDALLASRSIEGYLGAPLSGPDGRVLGHLAVFHTGPLEADERRSKVFQVFAARASGELARLSVERTLSESEERFRDLFNEAPIAYVHEDLDTRFIRANRAAMRTLGIKPEEVVGTYGRSFIPDTPEAQRRLREAFESVGRGTDTSGVVLELRRRDNGKPLWIQWWSKPDPGGTYTRTMFVDITEHVLLEQEQDRLKEQNRYLREEIRAVHNSGEIVGRNRQLHAVLESVERVAHTDATVLITGETGTGKELVARAIHSASRRRDKPLIKLNCAALPTSLVESELFGHEKGAFSGAIARRLGRFELAQGGTIFLDEVGEMPLEVQTKLLRVLQEREFERVGGSQTIQTDVRVIAATNRDLLRAMDEQRFRADLYYRLNVFPLQIPPLRDRTDDIPLLVDFFLNKFSARIGKQVEGATPELMRSFAAYHWPGNVRELENLLERGVILTNGTMLDADTIQLSPREMPVELPAEERATLEEVEREHIRATLERTRWVIEGPSGAARILAMHPNTLRSRMKKLGLSREGAAGG